MKRIPILIAFALLAVTGCTSFERATYQTLAASQAVINQAQTDYESGAIQKTTASYTVINEAKADQTLAVNAFVTYEEAKAANAGSSNLTALQNDVTVALANLPTIIADVKALYSGGK